MGYEKSAVLPLKEDRISYLIGNAVKAHNRCRASGSTWGVDYWSIVIKTLIRKYKRIH